jgi:hypothetical protein
MLSTRIRTGIVVLVTTCSLGVAGIAPSASQALRKGNNSAKKKICESSQVEYWRWTQIVEQDVAEGNLEAAAQDAQIVTLYLNQGEVNGCAWAALTRKGGNPLPPGEKPAVEEPPKPPIVKEGPVRPGGGLA